MTTFRNVPAVAVGCLAVLAVLFHPRPALAEVSAHGSESAPTRPVVILETNKLTDGSDPVETLTWERHFDPDAGHRTLNAEGLEREDGPPTIAIGRLLRLPVAAWARATPTGYDVVASRFVEGEWTEPLSIAAGAGDELAPRLVVDANDGGLHLVYWVREGGAARVEYREGQADGTTWSEPTIVSLPGEVAARPSIVMTADRLLIAYESHVAGLGSTPRQIVVTERVDEIWTSRVVAETWFAGRNDPGIHADSNRIWLEWVDGEHAMRWSYREVDESWTPIEVEPFDGAEDRDYHARGRVKAAVRSQ